MSRIHQAVSEEQQVLDANQAFYRALESLSTAKMRAVWWHEEWVECLHPGWPLVRGWDDIEESFASIFRSTSQLSVTLIGPIAHVIGDVGWISVVEQVTMAVEGDFAAARVDAFNLFVRRNGQWRMVRRHTSPIPGTGFAESSQSVQ